MCLLSSARASPWLTFRAVPSSAIPKTHPKFPTPTDPQQSHVACFEVSMNFWNVSLAVVIFSLAWAGISYVVMLN